MKTPKTNFWDYYKKLMAVIVAILSSCFPEDTHTVDTVDQMFLFIFCDIYLLASEIFLTNTASSDMTWNLSSVAPAYVKVRILIDLCRKFQQ